MLKIWFYLNKEISDRIVIVIVAVVVIFNSSQHNETLVIFGVPQDRYYFCRTSSIAEQFKVKGYPTLKCFVHAQYKYDVHMREAEKLVEFMKDTKEPPSSPPPETAWEEEEDTNVLFLSDQTFNSTLKRKKHALDAFYAPCKYSITTLLNLSHSGLLIETLDYQIQEEAEEASRPFGRDSVAYKDVTDKPTNPQHVEYFRLLTGYGVAKYIRKQEKCQQCLVDRPYSKEGRAEKKEIALNGCYN
uniref:Thioredoxin domain-containing protein n=1 Tax=Glossina pallidipes TaxID=7398 RepID=A0A1B0A605_GLOPL